MAPWLANKTSENLRRWIVDPSSFAVVAEADGEIIGVAMMSGSGEVTLCYLLPEVRYSGVGKALLAALEANARARGLGELRLHSTKTAHGFYLRNGFEDSGQSTTWHGIDCTAMTKTLDAR